MPAARVENRMSEILLIIEVEFTPVKGGEIGQRYVKWGNYLRRRRVVLRRQVVIFVCVVLFCVFVFFGILFFTGKPCIFAQTPKSFFL